MGQITDVVLQIATLSHICIMMSRNDDSYTLSNGRALPLEILHVVLSDNVLLLFWVRQLSQPLFCATVVL